MATAIKQRRVNPKPEGRKNGSHPRVVEEFAPGSLEAELAAIGRSVPARAWAKVPTDYFANLDHFRHGAPKKK